TFQYLLHGEIGIGQREQIVHRLADTVLQRNLDLSQAFVLSQHGAPRGGRAHLLAVDTDHSADRCRPVPVPAGGDGLRVLAEAQQHALFTGLQHVRTGQQPDDDDDRYDPEQQHRIGPGATAGATIATAAAFRQTRTQTTPELIQIGRAAIAVLAPTTPRILAVAGFIPGHDL